MSDIKMERLLNLTMALLAARRYLTKSEILKNVAGYSGSQEAMDRMFERDKDDLRNLGITIEVGSLDSLFDDELGYRIPPDSFTMKLPDLTPKEMAYISLASQLWKDTSLADSAHYAFTRLLALGIDVANSDEIFPVNPQVSHIDFESIWRAISESRLVELSYGGRLRKVGFLDLYMKEGGWYLVVDEIGLMEEKIFKISRIEGEMKLHPPQTFKRSASMPESDREVPSSIELTFDDKSTEVVEDEFAALHYALAHSRDKVLVSPAAIRTKVMTLLEARLQ